MANEQELTTQPNHADPVGHLDARPVEMGFALRNFIDDIVQKLNVQIFASTGIRIPSYTVTTLPAVPAADSPSLIFVSNETGGAVPAFSDGTNWRRVTDRAIVA